MHHKPPRVNYFLLNSEYLENRLKIKFRSKKFQPVFHSLEIYILLSKFVKDFFWYI